MPVRARRASFPEVVIERDTDTEESSEEEEEEEVEDDAVELDDPEEEEEVVEVKGKEDEEGSSAAAINNKKGKSPITISLKKVCKKTGHTTVNCPHRAAIEFGVIPASRKRTHNSLDYVFERQLRHRVPSIKPAFVIPDEVKCAVIRYHSRRITCLEFHPTNNNILLSGDKKGQLGVWDFSKVYEKTVYGNIHSCLLNNMKFSPANDGTIYAASSDGTVSCTDLETGLSTSLMDLNPNGWRMLYGMDLNAEKGLVLVADNFGFVHLVDVRSNSKKGDSILIHKKGTKVVGLHCNPVQPDLLLSCGNDHFARIWDIRRLEAESFLHGLPHTRVVNSAYFSPLSGSKIVTTSIDNRIRVWDSIFGNLDAPSREIVHNISTGQLVAEVMDPNITTISPVNKLHPRDDVLASGSSRKNSKKFGHGSDDDDDSGDDDFSSKK
ncbi:WD40 repeat-containing protein, partial [Cynara cardunculus var. scolymus]